VYDQWFFFSQAIVMRPLGRLGACSVLVLGSFLVHSGDGVPVKNSLCMMYVISRDISWRLDGEDLPGCGVFLCWQRRLYISV